MDIKRLKEALNRHPEITEYINTNNYESAYKVLSNEAPIVIRDFTLILYSSGINPLNYMTHVPPYFLYMLETKDLHEFMENFIYGRYNTFIIPDNIKSIGTHAFAGAEGIYEYKLPLYLESIDASAFYKADATVYYIPKTTTHISYDVFKNSYEKVVLNYEGNAEEFLEKVDNAMDLIDSNNLIIDYRG